MQFAEENFYEVLQEIAPLLHEHWQEIALNKDEVPLSPVWDIYKNLFDGGKLKVITAREDGKLVGYTVYIVAPSLHYASELFADADIFWLAPEYRKGMTGLKLFRYAEAVLKEAGVTQIFNKIKLHFDIGKVFERMGYSAVERVYSKRVI